MTHAFSPAACRKAGLTLVCLLVFVLFSGPCLAAPSPLSPGGDAGVCVRRIAKAIDSADAEAFAGLVDIRALAAEAFAELEKVSQDPETAKMLPPLVALMVSHGTLTSPVSADFFQDEVRSFVLYGVGSGAFAGRAGQVYKSDSLLSPLFSMVSMGRKEITRVGMPLETRDGSQQVPFVVLDHDTGGSYPVTGSFSRVKNGWRLTHIVNMREIVLLLGREALEEPAR